MSSDKAGQSQRRSTSVSLIPISLHFLHVPSLIMRIRLVSKVWLVVRPKDFWRLYEWVKASVYYPDPSVNLFTSFIMYRLWRFTSPIEETGSVARWISLLAILLAITSLLRMHLWPETQYICSRFDSQYIYCLPSSKDIFWHNTMWDYCYFFCYQSHNWRGQIWKIW